MIREDIPSTGGRLRQQASLPTFYKSISKSDNAKRTSNAFKTLRSARRRHNTTNKTTGRTPPPTLHIHDQTIGAATYNVRGLASNLNDLGNYLQGVKENTDHGKKDIVFLQETHLADNERSRAEDRYSAMWGFKSTAGKRLSFWSTGSRRAAGVAILINPYGAIQHPAEWRHDEWTEHLQMVQAVIADTVFIFVNIYAPSDGRERERFFKHLTTIDFPRDAVLLMGGDFNCVLDQERDRGRTSSRADVGATHLQEVLEQHGLTDAGQYHMPKCGTRVNLAAYAKDHHTYHYRTGDHQTGSSRLDRWYISVAARKWIKAIERDPSICPSDHFGVIAHMQPPKHANRVRKRLGVYPPPRYAEAASRDLISKRLQTWTEESDQSRGDERIIDRWEAFKAGIVADLQRLKKDARRRMGAGVRQRIKRLKVAMAKCDRLTETGEQKWTELLEAVRTTQTQRRKMRTRTILVRNAWSSNHSTRLFFRRICTKFGDNVVPTLTVKAGMPIRGLHEKADTLADHWAHIFSAPSGTGLDIEAYIADHATKWEQRDLCGLDEQITEDEVRAALRGCKAGKAVGPDDLSNDWYRDNVDTLVPILQNLFNVVLSTAQTPDSFLDAFIFCIRKSGDGTDPLNYRPIALLNSDYKIFTRILANRLRGHLAKLVHTTQFGFVPGRTIHEAIDLFEAAKLAVQEGKDLTDAQVVLLDFAKAYDSLNREFLFRVLRHRGFPPRFLNVVEAIHTGTTVRFMANGATSRKIPVTCGIRQGCPLAPLLFILAVDVLYDEVTRCEGISGIQLRGRGGRYDLVVAGYADDTAIYLKSWQMQIEALAAVQTFSVMSGLMLNVSKSAAIDIGSSCHIQPSADSGIGQAGSNDQEAAVGSVRSVRYLGHIATAADPTEEAWEKAFRALTVRLRLAMDKTNTAQQRAMIATAIIVPKLTFIARHAWPTEAIVRQADRRIRNFIWSSSFAETRRAPAGWINARIAELQPSQGGIAMPNISGELSALAACTVADIMLTTTKMKQTIGDILCGEALPRGHLTPYRRTAPTAQKQSLWQTGAQWANCLGAIKEDAFREEAEARKQTRRQLRPRYGVRTRWTEEGLTCDLSRLVGTELYTLQCWQLEHHGTFYHNGLMNLDWESITLLNTNGEACGRKYFGKTISKAHKVSDAIEMKWLRASCVRFIPLLLGKIESHHSATHFLNLCMSLIASFPLLLRRPLDPLALTVRHGLSDKYHSFQCETDENTTVLHSWGGAPPIKVEGGLSTISDGAVAGVLGVAPTSVWIVPHPALTRMMPLWAGLRRWTFSRKDFRNRILAQVRRRAKQEVGDTTTTWIHSDQIVANAVTKISWGFIHNMDGVPAYHIQNIHKLKLGRLRLWKDAQSGHECQLEECNNRSDKRRGHLAWHCHVAQHFWHALADNWGLTGPTLGNMLTFRLEDPPRWLVEWADRCQRDPASARLDANSQRIWDALLPVVNDFWRAACAATLTRIWRWNVSQLYEADVMPCLSGGIALFKMELRGIYERCRAHYLPLTPDSLANNMVATAVAGRLLAQHTLSVGPETHGPVNVAFFDGGSRGNPGPGGSGSIFVRIATDTAPRIIWASSLSLRQAATTNNVAEFSGLYQALNYAHRAKLSNVHVVGDSALILSMMSNRKMPKNRRLQHWYRISRQLADLVQVRSWRHHYRTHNKMADRLANIAMDDTVSRQDEDRPGVDWEKRYPGVQTHMASDVNNWQRQDQAGWRRAGNTGSIHQEQ